MNDGLLMDFMSLNNPQLNAQFLYYDQGSDVAAFQFRCFADNPIVTSQDYIHVDECTVAQGPASLGEVPARADQAVLMTVEAAPATIALDHKRVRLILEGVLTWEWDVVFSLPMFPFRLDGTWTQVR